MLGMLVTLVRPGMTGYHASHTRLTTVTAVELEIDEHSKVPAYQQLADQLRQGITSGEYGPRQAIPSLKQLQQRTGLAMGTIQHAIQVLEDEGLVYTVSGRGTFVSPKE
jgi:DNA-binding GntR family transcriptional regulator